MRHLKQNAVDEQEHWEVLGERDAMRAHGGVRYRFSAMFAVDTASAVVEVARESVRLLDEFRYEVENRQPDERRHDEENDAVPEELSVPDCSSFS